MAPSMKKKAFSVRGGKGKLLSSQNWRYFRPLPLKGKKWLFWKKMMPRNEIGGMTKKGKLALSFEMTQKVSSSFPFSSKHLENFSENSEKMSFTGRKSFLHQNFWFVQTAAPIPGLSRLTKKKALFSEQKTAFDSLSSWLPFLGKKHLKQILLHHP